MDWSPAQYLAFEDERTRPVRDLVNAIPGGEVRAAVDLGCGPGNSTEVLAARFPDADLVGLDNSPEMIAAARARLPRVRFELADIAAWDAPGPFDVILANAVLQWVPDHAALFPRLIGKLAAGGSLAVQMPDNLDEPSHRLMREVAASGPWAPRLAGAAGARTRLKGAAWYYALLRPHCARVDVWRTTYYHPLADGADGIVAWVKGTGLRPFLAPLGESERAAYLAAYRAEIARAYPTQPAGTTLLPFPRLFIVATRCATPAYHQAASSRA
jgi:trans-aconitate 2-methyltransferase